MDKSNLDRIEAGQPNGGKGRESREGPSATRSVPVLTRALAVLELLAESPNGLTLAEVARKLQMPKSTTHCILLTLLRQDYLTRSNRTRRYGFGPKLFSLVNHAVGGQHVREVAMPHLRQLMIATKLTVHMGILERGEAILVAKLDPPGVTGLSTWLGRRMDVHCTGVGKALIAWLPPDELQQLLRSRVFARHNENTTVSVRRLLQELESVRSLGYATDDEEDELGYRCLGVPIFGEDGRVAAAISVAGSLLQVTSENTKPLVGHLLRVAETIQAALKQSEERARR